MTSSAVGIICLLFFALSQGIRDAYFGSTFQTVSFFLIAILAFGLSTVCFTGIGLLRQPGDLNRLLAAPVAFIALNVTTAVAWLSFFLGLRYLEPAVVATLYNGVGPLTVLAMQASGLTPHKNAPGAMEWLLYVGVAASLTALVVIVLSNQSGLPITNAAWQTLALIAVISGGTMITVSHLIARWFNDRGVGSDSLMGTRFLLTLVAAIGAELWLAGTASIPPVANMLSLAAIAFALITLPSFALQLGIARAGPLAVNVFRLLGPVCVFIAQQLDGRLRFSGATLACIVAFCVFSLAASLVRGHSEIQVAGARH